MSLGQLLELVGGVIRLDPDAIRSIAQSPDGLRVALAIVLLGSLSDAIGNSPVLFLSGVGGVRFALCVLVDTLLSLLRVAIWIVSVVVLVNLLPQGSVSPAEATLIVGLGLAPMLFAFLALVPLLGPVLLRLLHAWVFVTTIVVLRTLYELPLGPALAVTVVGWLAVLVVGHTVDRMLVRGLGRLSQRLLGVDLLLRFDQVDLVGRVVAADPLLGAVPGTTAKAVEVRS
jgi:hypothetical protein